MPITTTCPNCKSLFRLPEELAGKPVRCQKCEQMFVVPMRMTVQPAIAIPEPTAPMPPAESPPTATSEDAPILATLAAEPTKEEVVVTAQATPSEEPAAKPKVPPAAREPERAAGVLWALAMLLLFLLVLIGSGGLAAIWVAAHLAPLSAPIIVPPLQAGGNIQVGFNGKLAPLVPIQLHLGIDRKVFVPGWTDLPAGIDHLNWDQDGPYRLYRIRLEKGISYNFRIDSGGQFRPRLRIVDPDNRIVQNGQAEGANFVRVMISYRPAVAGDHLLWITSPGRDIGNFNLTIEPAPPPQTILAPLDGNGHFEDARALTVKDPNNPNVPNSGRYKAYLVQLDAGETYAFEMKTKGFHGQMSLLNPDGIVVRRQIAANGENKVEIIYQAFKGGNYIIHAGAANINERGPYSLSITRQPK